jgi:hypothetical protein
MSNPTFETVQALIRKHGPDAAERILRTPPTIRHCAPGVARGVCDWNDYTARPMVGPGVAVCLGGQYTRPVFGGRGH